MYICGEGNGNPLQYSCLENPVDRGAWWAAVQRVTQSRTRLKRPSIHACVHWKRKWQPTPVFLPGESQGQRSLVGCHLWSCTESDMTEATQHAQHACICVCTHTGILLIKAILAITANKASILGISIQCIENIFSQEFSPINLPVLSPLASFLFTQPVSIYFPSSDGNIPHLTHAIGLN